MGVQLFGRFFQSKSKQPNQQVALQPVGEVFNWPKNTVLRPLDRVIIVLPQAIFNDDEAIGDVIKCSDDVEISVPGEDDNIYLRLDTGMPISITKNCQAQILSTVDGDTSPKRIQIG